MRSLVFVCLLLLASVTVLFANAIPEYTRSGQSTEVRFGERPFIDIYKVSDEAIEPGHIRIKLSESYSELADRLADTDGIVSSFGISELDELNQQYGIREIAKLFYSPATTNKYAWRHQLWGLHLWFELRFEGKQDIRELVMAYRNLTDAVQWAEPEYKKVLMADTNSMIPYLPSDNSRWSSNDPQLGSQWHYNNTGQTGGTVDADIDLFEAWDIEKGHPEVVVAVIDQGVQFDHPDLAANMWINTAEIAGNGIDDDGNGYVDDIYGYNFAEGTGTISAGNHGCHTAGTIAAVTNNSVGVAGIAGGSGSGNGVRIMTCEVFSSSNDGFEVAPIYAADNGAAISQNSWGYTNVGVYDQPVLDAIDYFNANGGGAVMNGGITIFAAGNSNSSGNWYPGYYSGAFSVAATNHSDARSYYSNYGTWVDVSAPGGETNVATNRGVLSCYAGSGYGYMQGTSMACPHTSGVAALVLSYAYRNGLILSNADLADLIRDTTDDHYAVNPSYIGQLGTGRVNAYSALLATDPTLPSCSITAPANGSVHDLNSTITINVTATDSDGYITGVDFYIDDVLQYTDTSSPYSWNWNTTGVSGGTHSIKVIATDNDNNTAQRTISVFLLAPPDEGFESGDFSAFAWDNSSAVPWTIQNSEFFSGAYAAKSGAINHSSTTTLSLPMTVSETGTISFWKKVSSESSYDFLRFYIDGVLQGSWSGSVNWSVVSFAVTPGPQIFSWTYYKDGSVSTGSDCAWIDHITFPPHGIYYAPPRNLAAVSGNGYVDLSWQVPATGTPTGYKVFRNGGLLTTTAGLTYHDTAVVNETSYSYYVTALYGTEESGASNPVVAYPTAMQTATLIIGTGTNSQTYPVDRYYNYSSHEAIYLASEIGSSCLIKSLGFNKTSGADVADIESVTIYLKHTTESTLASGTYSTAGYTQVYSGVFPNTATSGWMEVDLDNLFEYNGTSNLAILTIKGYQAWISSFPNWAYTTTSTTRVRQARSDDSQPSSLIASSNLPNLKLQVYLPPGMLFPARELTAVGSNGVVYLNWQMPTSGTPASYKIYKNGSLLTSVTELNYSDHAVVNGTNYSYYVVATYPEGDAEPTQTVFATPEAITSVVVGTGTSSNSTTTACPINVYYQSLHGQAVYTAAELNALGMYGPLTITQLGFNVTGLPSLSMPNYVIRMKHTTAINVADWIDDSNLVTVWSSESYRPTVTGWNMLTLGTPFVWNGTDNILIDTAYGLIGSYTSTGTTMYTTVTNGYRFIRSDYSDQTNVFTGGSTSTSRPNVQLVFQVETVELEAPDVAVYRSGDSVLLEWHGIVNATEYHIYHSEEPYGSYTLLDTTSALTYEITGTALLKEFFQVRAVNTSRTEAQSRMK